jgi:monoterpene epsilon-lactone hydrolase
VNALLVATPARNRQDTRMSMWLRLRWAVTALAATAASRLRRGRKRPTWGFGTELLFTFMRHQWDALWRLPAPSIRAELERTPVPRGAVRRITRTPVAIGPMQAAWFRAPEAADTPVILYFHGGSYLFGSLRTHADMLARLALATGVRVLGIEYRLAPEHPYPAALDDALAAYRWLLDQGIAPDQIALAGESAGGNLAAVAMTALRDAGTPLPACGVLLSPWVDLAGTHPSRRAHEPYDYGPPEMLLAQAREFAGGLALDDPRISPVHAELRGLPPLLVQVGEIELLADEARAFAERARAAGVDVTLDVLPDMPHAAPLFAAFVAGGRHAMDSIAGFVGPRLRRA